MKYSIWINKFQNLSMNGNMWKLKNNIRNRLLNDSLSKIDYLLLMELIDCSIVVCFNHEVYSIWEYEYFKNEIVIV